MIRLVVVAAVAAGFAGAAPAKEPPRAIRLCGVDGCRTVADPSRVRVLLAAAASDVRVRPARPAAYYTIRYVWHDGSLDVSRAYFVPAAGVLRTDAPAAWVPLGHAAGIFLWTARGLRAFPAPRVTAAEVDGRPVHDPASYLRLYRLVGQPTADPAGIQPSTYAWDYEQWSRYYERVRRHWLPVNVWTARASPWGDGDNYLWVGRRLPRLKRDGEVISIPPRLAACIRRAASVRRCEAFRTTRPPP
jgi:hypothetical protein